MRGGGWGVGRGARGGARRGIWAGFVYRLGFSDFHELVGCSLMFWGGWWGLGGFGGVNNQAGLPQGMAAEEF